MVRRLRARSVAIVMYHGVTAQPLPVFNWCQLSVDAFKQQLAYLASEYTVVPLSEVVGRMAARAPLPERSAVLTFDDGFRNVATTAYPLLDRYRLPATVFIVTNSAESGRPPWPEVLFHAITTTTQAGFCWDGRRWSTATNEDRAETYRAVTTRLKQMDAHTRTAQATRLRESLRDRGDIAADSPLAVMNWAEIETLARSELIAFGSHTHTHPILSTCSRAEQTAELRTSRDLLSEHLGRPPDLFAYPNGSRQDFTVETRALLREVGYRCGVATIPGLNRPSADLYELHRVNVGADMTMARFELAMLGL